MKPEIIEVLLKHGTKIEKQKQLIFFEIFKRGCNSETDKTLKKFFVYLFTREYSYEELFSVKNYNKALPELIKESKNEKFIKVMDVLVNKKSLWEIKNSFFDFFPLSTKKSVLCFLLCFKVFDFKVPRPVIDIILHHNFRFF